MVTLIRLVLALGLAFFASSASRAEDRPSMAVFPTIVAEILRNQFGDGKLDPQELTRQIEQSVRATRRFTLFERSGEILRHSVLLEQDFAQGGQALRNAAEAGKLQNVRFIAQPIVVHANIDVRRMQREERPGQYVYNATGSLAVTVKILDTTSGEIMYQTTKEAVLRPGNDAAENIYGVADEPLVRAAVWRALAADASNELTNAVVGTLFPIQVMQVQGSDIFVNRGEGAGISVGEHYQLFSVGAPLIDPATNEKVGNTEELVGDVDVMRVTPHFSVVQLKAAAHGTIKAGDILRPAP